MKGVTGIPYKPSQVRGTMPSPAAENPAGRKESIPRTSHMIPTKMKRAVPRALIDSLPSNMAPSVVHGHEHGVAVAADAHIQICGDATVGGETAVDRRQPRCRGTTVGIRPIPNHGSRRVAIQLVGQKVPG